MTTVIKIDGSHGEGGGQILRTSLALSMITGKAIHIINIRANRKKSGLMRQHLVCVEGAQQISNASVTGAELGSSELHFAPQQVQSGHYDFKIGSAGSTLLVLQTLLPALLLTESVTTLSIQGGTHNPLAPNADFIQHSFLPTIRNMGIMVDFELEQAGFAPVGAGKIKVTIHPWLIRKALNLSFKQQDYCIEAYACSLNLTDSISIRELNTLADLLPLTTHKPYHMQGISQGNSMYAKVIHKNKDHEFVQVFTTLGKHKTSAEQVAKKFAKHINSYLASDALVDEYLTDQLLLPMVLGRGGKFTTNCISLHTKTQAEMIQQFIECDIQFTEIDDKSWLVEVER